ncbi:hypothetical protein D3C72_1570990 [compost metagenome]
MSQFAADVEQQSRGVEVDAHAQLEIGFRLAADDGGQVEDRAGLRIDGSAHESTVGDVARDHCHARIVEIMRGHHVDQYQLADRLQLAVAVRQLALRQQLARQALPEESGAAGNQYFHLHAPCLLL